MSLGGALGGVFNALVAPAIFSSTYEYPLVLILACVLRAAAAPIVKLTKMDFLLPLAVLAAVIAVIEGWGGLRTVGSAALLLALLLITVGVFSLGNRALPFALAVAAVLVPTTIDRSSEGVLEQERSFFGVHRVKVDSAAPMLDLAHGTTLHGAEFTDPARWRTQVRYYYSGGPIGQFFTRLRAAHPGPLRISVTGLRNRGAGLLRPPGGSVDILRDRPGRGADRPRHALFPLPRTVRRRHQDRARRRPACRSRRDRGHRYDVLILDAFSSDAIPAHLLTKEAIELYLDQLSKVPRGHAPAYQQSQPPADADARGSGA